MDADTMQFRLRVVGTECEIDAENFVLPHSDDRINVRVPVDGRTGFRVEQAGTTPSCTYQLEAFIRAVREGLPMVTDLDDAVANMESIDACYQRLEFGPRPRSEVTS